MSASAVIDTFEEKVPPSATPPTMVPRENAWRWWKDEIAASENDLVDRYDDRRVCGGLCLPAHDWTASVKMSVSHIAIVLIFETSVVPQDEIPTIVVVALLSAITLLSAFAAACTDPGVLPRRKLASRKTHISLPRDSGVDVDAPAPGDREGGNPTATDGISVNAVTLDVAESVVLRVVDDKPVTYDRKLCRTCHVSRPPRSTHCQFCDWCVEDFDHHCGVIGSCVGRRNFRYFTSFLVFQSLVALVVAIRSVVEFFRDGQAQGTHAERWKLAATIICGIIPGMVALGLLPLATQYLRFAAHNLTVKEQRALELQGVYNGANPVFDDGCGANCNSRLCASGEPRPLATI